MNNFINYATVFEKAAAQIDTLVMALFPNARKQSGSWRVGGPEGERGTSFSISTVGSKAGCYVDHSDPSIKGNAIGLVALAKHLSYEDAGRWLADFLGVRPEERMFTPKQRQAPVIDRGQMVGLNKRSVDYAWSRGINQRTLKDFKCASTATHIVLPHFDGDGNTVMLKFWSCDDRKDIYTNAHPVPVLFGKHLVDPLRSGGDLIITEGQWDAMSWQQLGYPAVSIPSGVSNEEWIAEDWNFLNLFSTIYLDFDDDAPGREAEVRVKGRLGYERCRSISHRYKDANDALKAGDVDVLHTAFEAARDAPIERIVKSADIMNAVRDRLNRTHLQTGIPFFLSSLSIEFRPHEMTLWYGTTSHGKSTLLSQQIAFAASRGEMCMVASFEQATPMTLTAMMVQYTGDADIGQRDHFEAAYQELNSRVLFFDSMSRTSPDELIATMTMAHRQLGVRTFVIDNIMTLDVDRQDNTGQASVADKIRIFVAKYPVHVHEVGHPRKPMDGNNRPPSIQDIRGASEWGDMAGNVICVWRDIVKAEKLSSLYDDRATPEAIAEFDNSLPDGKVLVRKQRENGEMPIASYRFDRKLKRAWRNVEDLQPYWWPATEDDNEPF